MDRRKLTFLIFLMVLFISNIVYALTPEEKLYFDTNNQKVIAQLSSKIDTQVNRVETSLQTEVESARNIAIDELKKTVSGSMKAVAVGLAGLIILTLAFFKVIDLKISATRNMVKYERELKMKTDEFNKLIQEVQSERQQLQKAREQLIEYQNKLQKWEMDLKQKEGFVQQQVPQQPMNPFEQSLPPQYQTPISNQPVTNWQQQQAFPKPPQYQAQQGYTVPQQILTPPVPTKSKFDLKKIGIGILVLLIFGALAGVYYKFVILG